MAWYLTALFFLSMAGAGIVVDALFSGLHLLPNGPRPQAVMDHAHFAWNYTTWLDLAALVVGSLLFARHLRSVSTGKPSAHECCAH